MGAIFRNGTSIKDTVDVFHELAVTKSFIPLFVTDKSYFPSFDLENVGAVSIATDIMLLKRDINILKENKEANQSVLKEIQDSLKAIHSLINLNKYQKQNKFIPLHSHKGNYNKPFSASVMKLHINMSDKRNLQKSVKVFFCTKSS